MACSRNGKAGLKWGESGFCYTHDGTESGKRRARRQALRQARAAYAHGYRGDVAESPLPSMPPPLLLTKGRPKFRKRRIRTMRYPLALERDYERTLVRFVRSIESEVSKNVIPELPRVLASAGRILPGSVRADAWTDTAVELVQGVRHTFPAMYKVVDFGISQTAGLVQSQNAKQWSSLLSSSLGVNVFQAEPWLEDVMEGFVAGNVSLVQGLAQDTASKVEQAIIRGVQQGRTTDQITRSIMRGSKLEKGVFRKAVNRARLIARDQIGKLNGQLTHFRQTSLGITRYRWRTVQDSRVRALHAEREGRIYKWDKAPEDGHPGEAINCRCWAEPVLEDVLGESGVL